MTVTFKPLTNHLLLQLEPEPEQSQVIAVQKRLADLGRTGRVVSIGPEVRDVKPGQRVYASITAGVEMPNDLMMIAEDAVLGIEHQ